MPESYETLTLTVMFVLVDDLQTVRHRDARVARAEDVLRDFAAEMQNKIDGGMAIIAWGPSTNG